MATIALEDAVEQPPSQRAARSSRLLWLSCGLIVLWQVGGHVDAWYHTHYGFQIESFLTWPHALLYGSWASTLALVGLSILNRARRPEPAATPRGFRLIFLGVVLFGLGGAFDSMWHALFGFEVRLETLLSPAHLWLVASYGLVVFVVLYAAADHYGEAAATSRRLTLAAVPLIVCFAVLLRVLLWNLFYSDPLAVDYAAGGQNMSHLGNYPVVAFATDSARVAGVTGILLHSVLLALFLVVPLRRFHLPAGTIAAVMLWDAALTVAVTDMWTYLLAVAGAVMVGEAIWGWMRRGWLGGPDAELGYWVLGFAVPATQFALYFAVMAMFGGGIAWTVHLAAGTPVMAGFFGLLVALLVVPPRFFRIGASIA